MSPPGVVYEGGAVGDGASPGDGHRLVLQADRSHLTSNSLWVLRNAQSSPFDKMFFNKYTGVSKKSGIYV